MWYFFITQRQELETAILLLVAEDDSGEELIALCHAYETIGYSSIVRDRQAFSLTNYTDGWLIDNTR